MNRRRFGPLIALVALACAASDRDDGRPANFGVVRDPSSPHRAIYRGAQPTARQIAALRSDLGIRTIVKLNVQDRAAERAAATLAGIELIEVPIDPEKVGTADAATRAAVERAFAVVSDPRKAPVYVHCHAGRDRAGYLVGLYRARVQGWSYREIDAELARHGHGVVMRRRFPAITRALAAEARAVEKGAARRSGEPRSLRR